ncbi:MAG: outer membrane cobalamin receptor [Sulfurimonas sp.]|jgi:outer membrane cobalamin receptor|uniref:TonB-dependent receptor plug domain-containing protein n=1 Tax=Sulfurimonas sp. TaxID=2022749 RepID=UPI0039E58DD5
MKKSCISLCFLSSLLFSNNLTSIEEQFTKEQNWLEAETFVISASRIKENIKKTPASVTVIQEEQIEAMGAENIYDILKTVPGIDASGGNVYTDRVSVSGIQTWFSEKVLFLLDGHSLNVDYLNGGATSAYKDIPIELIKRVEVVTGPSSALYGENAFMGLVNIITKKAEDIDGTIVTIKGGSNEAAAVNLHYGKKYNEFAVTANINSKQENEKIFVESQNKETNPEINSFNSHLSLVHDYGFYFMGNFNKTNDKSKYGLMNVLNDIDYSKKETILLETGYKSSLNKNLDIHARVYYDNFDVENIWYMPYSSPSVLEYLYTTRKIGSEILLTYSGENFSLVSGISYEKQSIKDPYQGELNGVEEPNFIDEVDREVKSLFSELLYDVNDDFRVNVGVRYDYYSDFGSTINPRIGSTYSINKTNTLKLMYGEAFRAPTFAELYNKNNPAFVGNQNLKPETIKTTEITIINNDIDNTQLSFTLFKSDIDDLILVDASSGNKYMNIGKIITKGGKIELKYELSRGSYVLANYSYQDAQNKTTNEDMPDVSKHLGYAALNYRAGSDYNLYIDAKYKGEQTRGTSSFGAAIKSATIVNATLNIKDIFVDDMKMKLSINNLFNKTTYDSDTWIDYQVAERSFLAQLSYKF